MAEQTGGLEVKGNHPTAKTHTASLSVTELLTTMYILDLSGNQFINI